eukprot:scaffold104_cov375-Prasinococcus_capsulatus_cf.AAC.5
MGGTAPTCGAGGRNGKRRRFAPPRTLSCAAPPPSPLLDVPVGMPATSTARVVAASVVSQPAAATEGSGGRGACAAGTIFVANARRRPFPCMAPPDRAARSVPAASCLPGSSGRCVRARSSAATCAERRAERYKCGAQLRPWPLSSQLLVLQQRDRPPHPVGVDCCVVCTSLLLCGPPVELAGKRLGHHGSGSRSVGGSSVQGHTGKQPPRRPPSHLKRPRSVPV